MKMSNQVYDVLKWIVQYLLPAAARYILRWLVSGGCLSESRWSALSRLSTHSWVLSWGLVLRTTTRHRQIANNT